jgi:hypothetical protein
MSNGIFGYWERLFIRSHMSVNERRIRGFLALFLGLLTLALAVVGGVSALHSDSGIGDSLLWVGAALGALSLLALRYLANVTPVSYLGFTLTLTILTYQVAVGNGQGVAYLWFYFYPLTTFFLFGCDTGLLWVAASWFIAAGLLIFNWGPHPYPFLIGARFMATYTLVCILSYALESSRRHDYDQLLAEKAAVEIALQQVKTLQELLRICASCKKVRDDAGYWHSVETYIQQHTEVEFSHSICPECRLLLYPKLKGGRTSTTQGRE